MTRARFDRTWLWVLLAAALFMRAVVPQGYMPERAENGAIAVTLCGSDGFWLIPLEKHGRPDQQHADQPCAFAGLAAPSLAPPPSPAFPQPAPVAMAYTEDLASESAPATERLLPPVRGPPLPA